MLAKAQMPFFEKLAPAAIIPLADITGNCRGASSLLFTGNCFSHSNSISLSVSVFNFNDPSCVAMVQIVSHYDHSADVQIEIVLIRSSHKLNKRFSFSTTN
jgi:hypothetical protein